MTAPQPTPLTEDAPTNPCPFDDPAFIMNIKTPCPVCGDLGTLATVEEPSRCVTPPPS